MESQSELKPCPFCGKDIYAHDYNAFDSAVVCEFCFAKGPTGITKDAIAAWNTRRGEPNGAPNPIVRQ